LITVPVLKENNYDPKTFQIQFVAYRNYNAPESEILKTSGWCDNPMVLNKFFNDVPPDYGMCNEAIEIGLQYVNQDPNVSEIIVIGDAGANCEQEVKSKRNTGYPGGESYWKTTKFATSTTFDQELYLLQSKKIKINAFYLENRAKNDFTRMAKLTDGVSAFLDINATKAAEILTNLVSQRILNATGGDKLVKAYDKKFHVRS